MQDGPVEPQGDESASGSFERPEAMAPPAEPCECFCLHCRRIFMSDKMWFQRVKGARDGFAGFWMCPTPNCSGAGFEFDIFPTDPEHPANEGWQSFDSDEDGEEEEEGEWEAEEAFEDSDSDADAEWDPQEPGYQMMDEMGEDDDELEGEEWKYGLKPGEVPAVEPPPPGVEPRNWREEEALFDAPDRRPRELDWTGREDVPPMGEDDIPF